MDENEIDTLCGIELETQTERVLSMIYVSLGETNERLETINETLQWVKVGIIAIAACVIYLASK
jgi:hypothetical protein